MKKYQKGELIKTLDEFMNQDIVIVDFKSRWGRTKEYTTNKGWFQNWQIWRVKCWIDSGYIHKAIKVKNTRLGGDDLSQKNECSVSR